MVLQALLVGTVQEKVRIKQDWSLVRKEEQHSEEEELRMQGERVL